MPFPDVVISPLALNHVTIQGAPSWKRNTIMNREAELQSEAFELLHKINARSYCERQHDAIPRLMLIRCIAYESLSQIQHEWAVLKSLSILKDTYPEVAGD
jgi:hypothetical protein